MEKIFKKSLALMVSAALCLTAFVGCLTVNAEGTATPNYTITAQNGKAGDTVTVNVDGTNLTSVCGQQVYINIPSDLQIASVKDNKGNAYKNVANVAEGEAFDYSVVTTETTKQVRFVDIINFDTLTTAEFHIVFELTIPVAAEVGAKYDIAFDTATMFADINENAIGITVTPATITVQAASYEDANLKIRSAGITMANGFALDFKVRKTMETELGYTDIYLEFQKPRYDTDGNLTETISTTVTATSRTEDPTNSENYLYTLTGIQPQELATEVTATIYGTKDGHVYTGATVTYSVLKFATNQLKSSSAASSLKVACADMINFAAAVQVYGNYNTANPIIDKATELVGSDSWKSLATESITRDLVNAQTNTPFDGASVRVRSAGVIFEDKVVLYFNCADLGVTTLANPENYYLHATYTSVTGEARVNDLEIDSNFQAKLDTLYSTELGTVVTAYMVDRTSGEQVSNSVTYSIETFISKNLSNVTHGGWCTALIKYGDSVRAYAGLN